MREADLLVHRLPAELREPMRAAGRRLGASPDEVASAVDDLVRRLIREGFGPDPERLIVEELVARRRARDEAALARLDDARRRRLRRVG